jgi:hypothetical protein
MLARGLSRTHALDHPVVILADQSLEIVVIRRRATAPRSRGWYVEPESCMGTASAERTKLHRDRKRLGLRPVQVRASEREIDFLLARDYDLTGTDDLERQLGVMRVDPVIPRCEKCTG